MNEKQRNRLKGNQWLSYLERNELEDAMDEMDQMNLNIDNFSDDQLYQIITGLDDISFEGVKLYADPKFDADQMFTIKEIIWNSHSLEAAKVVAKHKYDFIQANVLREAFTHENPDIRKRYAYDLANPNYDGDHMRVALNGFEDGLTSEQVMPYLTEKTLAYEELEKVKQIIVRGANPNKAIKIVKNLKEN